MVHINLLPDARKEKLRDQSNRQLAISAATIAVAVSVGALVLLVIITQAQRLQISLLSSSISSKEKQITTDIPDAQAIATTQRATDSLGQLYNNQVKVSKSWQANDFIGQNFNW